MAIQDSRTKVVMRSVADRPVTAVVRECMELCEWERWVARNATVVLKPNLCTIVPEQMEKSNTDVTLTAAVCEVLLTRTKRIYIGEADHLRRTADQSFEITGHARMARELGIQCVNFSDVPRVKVPCEPIGEIEMPRLLVEADAFITLPVLKTHALTYFTGSLKNQWGCVPQHNRILLHRHIDALLASLQGMLLNLVLAGQDAVAVDATAMRLVGLEPARAKHLALAAEQGFGRIKVEEIEVDGNWKEHATQFKPGNMDWAIASMLYMSQYPWFVKYILEKNYVFVPIRSLVKLLRKVGVVGNG